MVFWAHATAQQELRPPGKAVPLDKSSQLEGEAPAEPLDGRYGTCRVGRLGEVFAHGIAMAFHRNALQEDRRNNSSAECSLTLGQALRPQDPVQTGRHWESRLKLPLRPLFPQPRRYSEIFRDKPDYPR